MREIIRNFLDIRTIEDGHRNLVQDRCSLHKIVGGVVSDYGRAAYRKHIQIINEIDEHSPDAPANPGATRQILDNLISNAVKYTQHHGTVHLSAAKSAEKVEITISNTGPGLSEKDQEKLWGKFTRLTPKPTGQEHSTGLGLWIVRKLATDMGGNTLCLSTEGEGSTSGVRLPLWTNSRHSTPREREDEESASFPVLISDPGKRRSSEVALSG